jgi:threonine/homoserine/homoserine lactone efflux protein
MFDEYEKKKRKQVSQMKSIMDYGMGILMILVGLFFLFHQTLNISIGDSSSSLLEKVFGGMCLLYGSWRIYRGYKKNYFR